MTVAIISITSSRRINSRVMTPPARVPGTIFGVFFLTGADVDVSVPPIKTNTKNT